MSVTSHSSPIDGFAGFPLSSWALAIRIWIAMMAALLIAFWLQLENASSAAVCVGILSLPTRGQTYEKAIYRLIATAIGVIVAIVLTSLFSNVRDLFIVCFAGWLAVCVYAASLLDGNRAYCAALSGYIVALIALNNIDTPQNVFLSGMNRGAAQVVGIFALTMLDDLLAPNLLPGLLVRLENARQDVRKFARDRLAGRDFDPSELTALLKKITAIRPDINALPIESLTGGTRVAAARRAITAMLREAAAARAAGVIFAELGKAGDAQASALSAVLDDPHGPQARSYEAQIDDALDASRVAGPDFLALSTARIVLDQSRLTTEALSEMKSGDGSRDGPSLPLFRLREVALRAALRIFFLIIFTSVLLIAMGWPMTSVALMFLAVLGGLSSTMPRPLPFAKSAIIMLPLASVLAGITLFLVLDGADAFPLLAIGMAPGIIGGGLLLGSGNPKLAPIGFLIVVFLPALLAPSNPQDYNPQTFIITCSLAFLGAVFLFIGQLTIMPTTDGMRRKWILRSIAHDFRAALHGPPPRMSVEEMTYRSADRIGQLGDLEVPEIDDRSSDLRHSLRHEELVTAAWRLRAALSNAHVPRDIDAEGRAALASLQPVELRRTANRLLAETDPTNRDASEARRWAAARLAWMAGLIDHDRQDIADFESAIQ
jgi:uncharacterized membrane protein YccC